MAGFFNRVKVWLKNETLKAQDLNAEFDNVIANIDPSKMNGDSATVAQMQIQVNPGTEGNESLAQTTTDEIQRLRFVLSEIIGQNFWYDKPVTSLSALNTLNTQISNLPASRLVSGKTRTTSNQPNFLLAGGSTPSLTLKAGTTPFVYSIDNTTYTISADVTINSLTVAVGSATAAVNDTSLAAQTSSATQGEGVSVITYDTATANFTANATVGSFKAFKIVHSATTEYFIGYVNSSTQITKCFRGYFFGSDTNPIGRTVISDNDVITLMKLTWVFANTTGGLAVTYNNPVISFAQPTSPAIGDYWYDLGNSTWKTYNSTAFVVANATLIGIAIQDTSNCIGSRSFNFYAAYEGTYNNVIDIQDTNTLRTRNPGMRVSVAGKLYRYDNQLVQWVKPTNFDTGITDTNNATYYAYLKDTGDVVLSDIRPYDRTADMLGYYHPYNPWRCLASCQNNGSAQFTTLIQFLNSPDISMRLAKSTLGTGGSGFVTTSISLTNVLDSATNVMSVTVTTSGGPIRLMMLNDDTATPGNARFVVTASGTNDVLAGTFEWFKNGVGIGGSTVQSSRTSNSNDGFIHPPTSLWIEDTSVVGQPGVYTYTMKVSVFNNGSDVTTMRLIDLQMYAYEVK